MLQGFTMQFPKLHASWFKSTQLYSWQKLFVISGRRLFVKKVPFRKTLGSHSYICKYKFTSNNNSPEAMEATISPGSRRRPQASTAAMARVPAFDVRLSLTLVAGVSRLTWVWGQLFVKRQTSKFYTKTHKMPNILGFTERNSSSSVVNCQLFYVTT